MARVTTTAFTIAGQATAWICNPCVRRDQIIYLILFTVFPLFAFFGAYQIPGAGPICTGVGILLLIVLPIIIFKSRQEFGERVAISVRKRDLKAQNYNAFVITKVYKKMRPS